MREEDTRLIPYAASELAWARQRPAPHRVPVPRVGDEVLYRHDYWGPVEQAEALAVQSLTDLDDPMLWQIEVDGFGHPLTLEGRPVISQLLDPWPTVDLRIPGRGVGRTREARLRGSPGWLPLDWETRYRPLPEFAVIGG